MATVNGPTAGRRRAPGLLRDWLPSALLAAWVGGVPLIGYVGREAGWSPGTFVLAGCAWLLVLLVAARNEVRNMFGPVFTYEVVRLGRRRLTFVMRFLYVAAVMAVLGLLYMAWLEDVGYFRGAGGVVPHHRLNEFASIFFHTFIVLQFAVVAFLTPAYVAGTVADEKERKTLEFLLATDLQNREIVFGKLAARVTNLLTFVLAGLPVVAFMQLFGGIDPDLLLAAVAATVLTVVGFAAVGVFFSVTMRKPRDAIALTYLSLAVYLVGSAFLAGYFFTMQMWAARNPGVPFYFLGYEFDPKPMFDVLADVTGWVAAGNVAYHFFALMVAGAGTVSGTGVADALFRYAVFWGVVSAALLAYSVWRLRAIALRQSYGAPRVAKTDRRGRAVRTRPPVGDDPMFWKEVHAEPGMRGGCVGFLVSAAITVLVFGSAVFIAWLTLIESVRFGGSQGLGRRWEDFAEGMSVWVRVATGGLGFIAMMAATVRGASAVTGEKDRDTWVSLVSTPLTAWEMLRGKWLGAVLGLRRVYALILLVWATALAVGGANIGMLLVTAVFLAVYVSGFAWLGIYCSVTARNTLIATVRALMAALFLAGGFWIFLGFCCAVPMSMVTTSEPDFVEDAAEVLLGWTPPFVAGWLPLNEFENDRDLEPFAWERYNGQARGIGPLSPVLGLLVWFGLNWLFGYLAYEAFARQTNRTRDTLARSLPRPRPPRPTARPAEPKSAPEPADDTNRIKWDDIT